VKQITAILRIVTLVYLFGSKVEWYNKVKWLLCSREWAKIVNLIPALDSRLDFNS
ncbi:Hypothetical protein FKW44_005449, partial [Caligus rogercresseyi]